MNKVLINPETITSKIFVNVKLTSIMLMLLAWTCTGVFYKSIRFKYEPSCQPCSAF
jgi:hypothetical protein